MDEARSRSPTAARRRFTVHATQEVRGRAHVVEDRSFEAAALHFVEHWHAAGEPEAVVIVEDFETGEQQCFRVDLGAGETTPCE
jgi:hypothetical protein